jgi:hypothetical protein
MLNPRQFYWTNECVDQDLSPFHKVWGAPYLARFSRDVGYHEPQPFSGLKQKHVERCSIPDLAKNGREKTGWAIRNSVAELCWGHI